MVENMFFLDSEYVEMSKWSPQKSCLLVNFRCLVFKNYFPRL